MTTIDSKLGTKQPALSAHRVVILGGTGRVGEGIVRSWLAAGAEVIIPTRTENRGKELLARLENIDTANLELVVGEYTSFTAATDMAQRITGEFGDVTDVIAAIGGWWQGKPLWEVTESEWQRFNLDLSTAHVANVRAWLPLLAPAGSYHLVLGGSATTPVPGASIINMEQAGLLMMHRVLSAEAGTQRRVFAHELGPVATRERPWVDPQWITNEELGSITAALAARPERPSAHYTLRTTQAAAQLMKELAA
ncbi:MULTISPECIES: SDR family oxidoreductase [unclassified Glutamicibacter]|uniref:SDR family oxidoreductase n=1 Tax=unclassified Glutamicibacter TaxID=2627139 RepID=UPI0038229CC9